MPNYTDSKKKLDPRHGSRFLEQLTEFAHKAGEYRKLRAEALTEFEEQNRVVDDSQAGNGSRNGETIPSTPT